MCCSVWFQVWFGIVSPLLHRRSCVMFDAFKYLIFMKLLSAKDWNFVADWRQLRYSCENFPARCSRLHRVIQRHDSCHVSCLPVTLVRLVRDYCGSWSRACFFALNLWRLCLLAC